ncbi:MAG: hypothetical protein J2P52_03135 [Blastocatellia bacterium]|nr:hypothetical protein [Blastocatellia bacterium]
MKNAIAANQFAGLVLGILLGCCILSPPIATMARAQSADRIVKDEPLPELDAVLARLRESQQALEQLRDKYSYTETATQYQLDKQGAAQEKGSEIREMTIYRGHRIWRTIAKNGQPLSSKDQAKEDRRVEKMIRDLDSGRWVAPPDNQRRVKLSDLLRVSRFIGARRERFRQRDVIVIDFGPNPNFKTTNFYDRFINNLAGTIWVDERDLQIARAEFQLVEAFKIGGGALAAMKPGSRFVSEQGRISDGIWLPIYDEVRIGARAMLVANFDIKQKFTYDAYRRSDANSEEKLKSPVADK